ncbi:enoyl-CoA hydratase-related protein [Pigmentiphaga sp. GD03639]|uniref:enoyl-CoA hydratase/isomerase family protein n=1 Tax=unclassified Pigmentiphaga TaxID=2626614 RepID=UPI000B41C309|nr:MULTISPECIES: enoyl-CoA hydratase-related protein [unclassified Pigmentiphaga]MDH2237149.1 enoyl-CoA hydratase-related protein [Pigmentiphaga sp. GD03639]OVZ65798.1 enoyl-CoA hydratase [Pigmentiphaga sp. NML030171]
MSEDNLILFEVDTDGIAVLTLNRPEKYNAFTKAMIIRWNAILEEAAEDPAVKAIILTGAGKAFCTGGDVNAQKERANNDALERKDFLFRHVHKIAFALERMDKPVIAAVNGTARGAGMDMALMCDLRIMAQTATMAESYINVGLIAGDGGTWYLPRLIGTARALELCWTGRVIDAAEAERIGLVNRVVPEGEALNAAKELARTIAAQPFEAVRAYKRSIYQGMTMTLASHLDMVSSHTSILRETPDHRERVAAFLDRKKKA